MEFLSAQRLKSGNSRSLIFGHECEGKFHFYICIGMLLISLSCWCKGKNSGKYSLSFSVESYQGDIQVSFMLWIAVHHEHNEDDPVY